MIATLLLAAGASSRMGVRDKLMEQIDGQPLLAVMAARALENGPLYVTLPARDHPRAGTLPQAAQVVAVTGQMSDSIKAGIAALPDDMTGVVILPADMPAIAATDIAAIITCAEASQAPIVRATTDDGKPGHPIYFARSVFDELATITGDRGAHAICVTHKADTEFVPLAGNRARLDLDTPEEWSAYRRTL